MSPEVERRTFAWQDPAACAFLADRGYVVVDDLLGPRDRTAISDGWKHVVTDAARRVGLAPEDFVERFPQNRDLWRKHAAFERLLFATAQADAARRFLSVSSVRLFHDHAICKPTTGSGVIPWHQDSAYWPLDRVGLSLWTPTDDVDADGGCLEVLAGSHRDGPREPQDFLARRSPVASGDPRRVLLPVAAGATVILTGLTWHRSEPNRSARERLAYLTLWVPATARFVPEHAGWHPSATHVDVAPGERLDGDWFPRFGTPATDDDGELVAFPRPPPGAGPSMFTASSDIAGHLAWIVGRDRASLASIFAEVPIDELALRTFGRGLIGPEQVGELRDVLEALALQDRVRRVSVARDVYLRTVERWWSLVGHRLQDEPRER